ncbi:hypothetical protein [Azospirillum sp. B4]|uniref:hypothetical protein n=1 Tax=Azospirillum sp. B4 TaxID=95605 RepID=UPI0005CA26BC|nr:hypothetical protein [Azospirillum sp. B4]
MSTFRRVLVSLALFFAASTVHGQELEGESAVALGASLSGQRMLAYGFTVITVGAGGPANLREWVTAAGINDVSPQKLGDDYLVLNISAENGTDLQPPSGPLVNAIHRQWPRIGSDLWQAYMVGVEDVPQTVNIPMSNPCEAMPSTAPCEKQAAIMVTLSGRPSNESAVILQSKLQAIAQDPTLNNKENDSNIYALEEIQMESTIKLAPGQCLGWYVENGASGHVLILASVRHQTMP